MAIQLIRTIIILVKAVLKLSLALLKVLVLILSPIANLLKKAVGASNRPSLAISEIAKIKDAKARGYEFERLVRDVYRNAGDDAHTVDELKAKGYFRNHAGVDQGADVLIMNGSNIKTIIQCKFYSSPVGNKAVQEIVAAKGLYAQNRDVNLLVVSNNGFTDAAIQLAKANGVRLVDGKELNSWIKKFAA